MPTNSKSNRIHLSKLILGALRWPFVIFTLGVVLVSLKWMRLPYPTINLHIATLVMEGVGNALMGLSGVLFAYLAVCAVLQAYEKIYKAENKSTASHILSTIRRGLRIIFVFFTLSVILNVIELNDQYLNAVHKSISLAIVASIAWLVLRVISTLEVFYFSAGSSNYTRIHQVRNLISGVVIIIAFGAGLMVFDSVKNIGISVLASAGFLTAIIGLAAQKTIGSLVAGVQVAIMQPFRIGDQISIESEKGCIEEITLNCVTVKMWDCSRLVLPVSYFLDKPIRNWSRDTEELRGEIKFYADYLFSLEVFRGELDRILNQSSWWNKKISACTVSDIRERAIEIRVVVSAATLADLDSLKALLREKLLEFIGKNNPGHLPRLRIDSPAAVSKGENAHEGS